MGMFESQQLAFEPAKSKAVLKFQVKEKSGFAATAALDLDGDTVAKFKSVEIVRKVVTEPLIPTGSYTLEIDVILTSKAATDINVEVSVTPPGKPPEVQTATFLGKKRGDVCQVLAFVFIQ